MLELILLFLGLAGLWLGSQLAIQGVLDIARHYKISHTFLGLTVLALGTDLPELFIDVSAALKRLQGVETSGLVIGETIGTCFSQIGLMLGIVGLIATIKITKRELKRDGFMLVGSVVLLFLLGLDGEITRTEGVMLMLVYVAYFLTIAREEQIHQKFRLFAPKLHLLWAVGSIVGGFAILIFSSQLTIDNALLLSERFGIAQRFVGILIVGLGTSLPELATSLTAVSKKAVSMAAGNLLGSNIFDILFTLGLGSAISGFTVHASFLSFDIPALILFSLFVVFFIYRNMRLERWEAYVLIVMYLLYYLVNVGNIFTTV